MMIVYKRGSSDGSVRASGPVDSDLLTQLLLKGSWRIPRRQKRYCLLKLLPLSVRLAPLGLSVDEARH